MNIPRQHSPGYVASRLTHKHRGSQLPQLVLRITFPQAPEICAFFPSVPGMCTLRTWCSHVLVSPITFLQFLPPVPLMPRLYYGGFSALFSC